MAVETKRLMGAATIISKKVKWIFIAVAIAMVISVIGILFLPVLYVIYLLFTMFRSKSATPKVKEEARAALISFVGRTPAHIDVDISNSEQAGAITGTGIAYLDKTLYVMEKGLGARIPLEDIRDWRWEIPGHDEHFVNGGNSGDRAAAAMRTTASKSKAAIASGVFVNVKDLQKPEWQFRSDDVVVLKRWQEILTQATEGKI